MSRRPPDIEVHIEELVLHGLGDVDRWALRGALERELAQRLSALSPIDGLSSSLRMERFVAEDIALPPDLHADATAAELARTLCAGFTSRFRSEPAATSGPRGDQS